MKQYLFKSILALGAAAVIIGCSEEVYPGDEEKTPGRDSDKICFVVFENSTSRGGSPQSRRCGGAFIFNGKDSLYLSLTVSGQDMPDTRGATIADDSPLRMTCLKRTSEGNSYYFSNVMFSKVASDVWESNPEYWWLDENTHFKFYGYAPADAKGATYIADEATWQPKLDFTVPANATDQSDLVYHDNYNEENRVEIEYVANDNRIVPLTMKHALACVGFRTGTGMANGKITKVTLTDVVTHGTLNLTKGEWTLDETTIGDVSASIGKQTADGLPINTDADNTYFMLLPGCNTNATTVTIDFEGSNGVSSTYTGTFPADTQWAAGNRYTYTITIDPDLNFELVPSIQDAHYVIAHAKISATNMQPNQEWEVTATADDGADVSLLATLNEYQKLGFWTDRDMFQADGSDTASPRGSARGSESLSGTGDSDIYVFIPENFSEKNRTITLDIHVKGSDRTLATATFQQHHPDWTGAGFGWEQIEDDEGQWGFNWNRKVTYKATSLPIINSIIFGIIRLIYNARNYTSLGWASITIDYSVLNSLNGVTVTDDDGLQNTRNLYGYSGGATTGNLERVLDGLNNVTKTESGNNNVTSAALGYVMRKNRYDLLTRETTEGGQTITTTSPVISTEDIVWYLPAKDQMKSSPTEVPLNGTYWTSNPDGAQNAFTNNGSDLRSELHKIRACRNRP